LIARILATACAAVLLSSPALAQQPAAPRGAVFPVASLGGRHARLRRDRKGLPLDVRAVKDGVRLYARKGYYAPRPESKAR
jgi:hypothetical protein